MLLRGVPASGSKAGAWGNAFGRIQAAGKTGVRTMMNFHNSKKKQRIAAIIIVVVIVAMVLGTIVSGLMIY